MNLKVLNVKNFKKNYMKEEIQLLLNTFMDFKKIYINATLLIVIILIVLFKELLFESFYYGTK